MPLSFWRETITVQRAAVTTKNGMEVFDWSHAAEHTINRCQVTAQATSRDYDRTLQVPDHRTLRAPYDADIKAGDRIVWNGDTYEIEGEVFHTRSPLGGASSTRCTLARWEG